MGEDTTFADIIRLIPPEEISMSKIHQRSVKKAAHAFYEQIQKTKTVKDKLADLDLKFGGRVLLVGPIGTDFDVFIQTICMEMPLKLLEVEFQKIVDNPERLINGLRTAFELAKRDAPLLVRLDEVDLLSKINPTVNATFAEILDSISWDEYEVIMVANTTRYQEIDEKVLGLFDQIIVFQIPTEDDRTHVLETVLASPEEIDMEKVLKLTEGWGFSDLKRLASQIVIFEAENNQIGTEQLIQLVEEGTIIPVGGAILQNEIRRRMKKQDFSLTGEVEAIYPDEFLDQLYLMAVSENYPRTQKVIEALNGSLPLDNEDIEFLNRFPFLLSGDPQERLTRVVKAKKSYDRIMRVMGRER